MAGKLEIKNANGNKVTLTVPDTITEDKDFDISGFTSQNGAITTEAPFYLNKQIISESFVIPTGYNAMSAGPLEVADNVSIEVPDGSSWTIV